MTVSVGVGDCEADGVPAMVAECDGDPVDEGDIDWLADSEAVWLGVAVAV